MKKFVFDTNALIDYNNLLGMDGHIIIPEITIAELDKLKMGLNDAAYRARQAIRKLKNSTNIEYDFEFGRSHVLLKSGIYNNDDLILECAKKHEAILITGDFNLELKAKASNIEIFDTQSMGCEDDYSGYKEIILEDHELATFYEDLTDNKYGLLINQYIIIKNPKGDIIETSRWDGKQFQYARNKGFQTAMFGKFTPLDQYQICALDSLNNNQMTMIKGKAGSGKSLIALNYAWSQIEKTKYEKLIIFTNPVASKNSAKLGYYPGTRNEKLLGTIGTMLASKFGDIMEVERQIAHGKLMLLPFADIRGFDTTGQKAIIWFIECQNLDIDLMKLGISRCGNDSKVILDGDYNTQVDMEVYAGYNNGMRRVSEIFRGKPFYGEVELRKVHRSKMAEYADLL